MGDQTKVETLICIKNSRHCSNNIVFFEKCRLLHPTLSPPTRPLTIGSSYSATHVLGTSGDYRVRVLNDDGYVESVPLDWFRTLREIREEKIKYLIEWKEKC